MPAPMPLRLPLLLLGVRVGVRVGERPPASMNRFWALLLLAVLEPESNPSRSLLEEWLLVPILLTPGVLLAPPKSLNGSNVAKLPWLLVAGWGWGCGAVGVYC